MEAHILSIFFLFFISYIQRHGWFLLLFLGGALIAPSSFPDRLPHQAPISTDFYSLQGSTSNLSWKIDFHRNRNDREAGDLALLLGSLDYFHYSPLLDKGLWSLDHSGFLNI